MSPIKMACLRCLLCMLSKRNKTRNKTRLIPQLQQSNDTVAASDMDKAEVLNTYFVGQSEQSARPGPIPRMSGTPHRNKLYSIEFSVQEVQNLSKRLDLKKSAGTMVLRLYYSVSHQTASHHVYTFCSAFI